MLTRLVELQPELTKRGVTLAAVTMGEPGEAAAFGAERAPNVIMLSDPQQEAYRAYGLGRAGLLETMGPGVWASGFDLVAGGHMGGAPMGDVRQMPGIFIVGSDGRVQMAYYSKHIGDHPKPQQILATLDAGAPMPAKAVSDAMGQQR